MEQREYKRERCSKGHGWIDGWMDSVICGTFTNHFCKSEFELNTEMPESYFYNQLPTTGWYIAECFLLNATAVTDILLYSRERELSPAHWWWGCEREALQHTACSWVSSGPLHSGNLASSCTDQRKKKWEMVYFWLCAFGLSIVCA